MNRLSVFMNSYQKYVSFFRMRFIAGLQYRAAALAGMATQFVWGFMQLLAYHAFYAAKPGSFPMNFQALSSYIWLQQALLALFMPWFLENDIFQTITDGGVAYELCRPADLYNMWFFRSMATRLSRVVLRCFPIFLVAAFLPEPYGIRLPENVFVGIWFIITALLAFLLVVAFCMLIYIATFYMYSPQGIRIVALSVSDFLAGNVVPLPFLPGKTRQVVELLPFASMQNIPYRVYSGDIAGKEIFIRAGLQLFWVVILTWTGRKLTACALKKVVVQGG